jgi:hypothetical protein
MAQSLSLLQARRGLRGNFGGCGEAFGPEAPLTMAGAPASGTEARGDELAAPGFDSGLAVAGGLQLTSTVQPAVTSSTWTKRGAVLSAIFASHPRYAECPIWE